MDFDRPPTSIPPALTDALDWSVRDWIEYHQRELAVRRVSYRGVPCWKNVMDLWVYQEILWETQVEAVVEIGVMHGGTSLWLSDMLRLLAGEQGLVVSVDRTRPAFTLPSNVRFVQGRSLDPTVVSTVSALCEGKRTMVIADGDHTAQNVLGELREYGAMVTKGCYFVAEDSITDVMGWQPFVPGPQQAIRAFLRESDLFVIDKSREKYVLTYCPDGFLLRIA